VSGAPIRVWLEPGYDGGRYGTWLLDLPGAFSWDTSRERALSQAPAVAGRFRTWLAEHGEALDLAPIAGTGLVEEVEPTWLDDGYERNATFEADRRPVAPGEVDAVERRLGYARADLLALAERIAAHEARHGPLPTEGGKRRERAAEEVLRHLAGAEVWLAGRVDGGRYEGPRDGDLATYLESTRAWVIDQVRALPSRVGTRERTDSKGETWTLAKVLRRLVYHSLDHFFELELRLARADGTIDRLRFGDDRPSAAQLGRLLLSVGWDHRAADPEGLGQAIEGATEVVSVWADDRLVGFARAISDRAWNAYISTVVVDPRWQGIGIAGRMVRRLLAGHDDLRFGLSAMDGLDDFYARFGFEPNPNSMVRRRRV
jgi:GNAT superfamily N-acetyltransferase